MISSNGLIIIEMVSSETVDRGTVLFILKGETCLNGICHGAFGEVYGRSFVCFLGGVVRLSPPKKSFMYYQNKLSRYKYMGEKTILLLHLHTYYMPSDRHYWDSSFFASSPVTVCFIMFLAVYYQPRLAITLLVERNFIIIALIHQHIAH